MLTNNNKIHVIYVGYVLLVCHIGMHTIIHTIGMYDKRSIKIGNLSNVGTFPYAYSLVFQTYIISNVNIDFAMKRI